MSADARPGTDDSEDIQPTTPLRLVAIEIEQHVGAAGWDQPPRLFALARTRDLLRAEPSLGASLAESLSAQPDGFTPIEQEDVLEPFEQSLSRVSWPDVVTGCAAVVERIMLPTGVEDDLPQDPAELERFVADHPERQEVRLVAAVLRDGQRHTMVRSRTRENAALLEGPDLVPGLVAPLLGTLA